MNIAEHETQAETQPAGAKTTANQTLESILRDLPNSERPLSGKFPGNEAVRTALFNLKFENLEEIRTLRDLALDCAARGSNHMGIYRDSSHNAMAVGTYLHQKMRMMEDPNFLEKPLVSKEPTPFNEPLPPGNEHMKEFLMIIPRIPALLSRGMLRESRRFQASLLAMVPGTAAEFKEFRDQALDYASHGVSIWSPTGFHENVTYNMAHIGAVMHSYAKKAESTPGFEHVRIGSENLR